MGKRSRLKRCSRLVRLSSRALMHLVLRKLRFKFKETIRFLFRSQVFRILNVRSQLLVRRVSWNLRAPIHSRTPLINRRSLRTIMLHTKRIVMYSVIHSSGRIHNIALLSLVPIRRLSLVRISNALRLVRHLRQVRIMR